MQEQQEKIEKLIPGIIVPYPRNSDEEDGCNPQEDREYSMRRVFSSPEGSAAHQKCIELEKMLNTAVAPDVVVGKVVTDGLQCSIPSMDMSFSLPMAYADAASLYSQLDPSMVGVELRGDVLDTDLRRSHEVLASKVTLPAVLKDFAFPEEVRRLHESLCPSADAIRIEPYKLIFYAEGDFFVPHRDSMDSEENMFGTISLGLPIQPRLQPEDPNADRAEETRRGIANAPHMNGRSYHPGEPGQLVLYVGCRESDKSVASFKEDRMKHDMNALTYVVDMEGVVETAVTGTDGKEGLRLTMSYGAWTGDVLHEVRRLDSGYRAVLTYKMFKQGHHERYIPAALRTSVEREVADIVSALGSLTLPETDREDGQLPAHFHLGFALRHGYPPAGLRAQSLKGIDAIVYSIVSAQYDSVLFTGYEVRAQDMFEVHVLPEKLYDRIVFVTRDVVRQNLSDEDAREWMAQRHPVVANTVWLSLGYGTLVDGGFCFGNADCGTDWWYRQSFLLLGPRKAS